MSEALYLEAAMLGVLLGCALRLGVLCGSVCTRCASTIGRVLWRVLALGLGGRRSFLV